jgi:hypothetical protein
MKKISKKSRVLEKLFRFCQDKNDFVFDNNLVKKISEQEQINFKNQFDATKLDKKKELPNVLLENDYALIHLGSGYHKFIKGINRIYHNFEEIQKIENWEYKKSILNQYNTSESNFLSVANNQRILHHFLFGKDTEFDDIDISKRPKTYFPHRTKTSLEYYFGNDEKIKLDKIQIEIDLTIEFEGTIGVFEAKNGKPDNFAIYQIYHPFLYYYNAKNRPEIRDKIKGIYCVYVVREKGKKGDSDTIKLWKYTFEDPFNITSIKLIKSVAYKLIGK